MKRFLFILSLILMMISCDKPPINGDLDGMWKMTLIKYSNGEEMAPKRIFFCIERNCIELNNKGESPCNYIGRMNKESDIITIDNVKDSNGNIKDIDKLKQFGIFEMPAKFDIEKLNSSKLIIKSKDCILYFTKF